MNNYLYDYRLTIFYIFINFSKLTKFKYFGHSGSGKKDGHTKQIEDVTDELVDAIDENPTGYTGIIPIMLQFTITN